MKWRAAVRRTTGKTRHTIATLVDGKPVATKVFDAPTTVEISAEDNAFFVFRHGPDGEFLGDTWHQTFEEAKGQAFFEYEIRDEDWVRVED